MNAPRHRPAERAEDEAFTLEEVLGIDRNRDVFRLLGEQLATRIGVVPFVGAGLSIPLGMPGWANFLREEGPGHGLRERGDRRRAHPIR